MADCSPSLAELYDLTCEVEEKYSTIKAKLDEHLEDDRSRVLMSLSCLRVGLELRIRYSFPKRADLISTEVSPRRPRQIPPLSE